MCKFMHTSTGIAIGSNRAGGYLQALEYISVPDILVYRTQSLPKCNRTTGRSNEHRDSSKRGPQPEDKWVAEIRRAWSHIDDEFKLEKSWLANQPQVQRLAASDYSGGSIGKGRALQRLLKKALLEARKSDTDEKTRQILSTYPSAKITDIARTLSMSREQVSHRYVAKAARLLTSCFRRVLEQPI